MSGPSAPNPGSATSVRRPRPTRWGRWATWLAVAYLVVVLVLCLVLWSWADEWWPATLLAFGPRWVAAVPLAVLAPLAAAARSARAGWVLLASGAVVAGPLLGGRVTLPAFSSPPEGAPVLRVMTWNAGGVGVGSPAFHQYVGAARPDLILLQEAGSPAARDVPEGWTLAPPGGVGTVLLTRLPAKAGGAVTAADLGVPGACSRFEVETPVGPVVVVNVHLPTPRPGIERVLRGGRAGVPGLEEVTLARGHASALVADWVGPPADGVIVAGDFNTPVESVLYRRYWGGFANAFSAAGTGWGPTKQTRWFGARIDHVLFAPPWRCRAVRVGQPMGSDHCPVVADLVYAVE